MKASGLKRGTIYRRCSQGDCALPAGHPGPCDNGNVGKHRNPPDYDREDQAFQYVVATLQGYRDTRDLGCQVNQVWEARKRKREKKTTLGVSFWAGCRQTDKQTCKGR